MLKNPMFIYFSNKVLFIQETLSKNKYLLLFICFISCVIHCHAISFSPIVQYFSNKKYDASHQNWCASQDERGVMYFANNDGLISYDGYRWKLIRLGTNYLVRSVMCEGNRVYVGAFEEFGYFEPDANGTLVYNSLSTRLLNVKMRDDDIWKIFRVGNNIYFQSFKGYYKYDGKNVIGYEDNNLHPLYIHHANGKLYAQIIEAGLFEIVNDKYVPFIGRDILKSDVVSIIPGRSKNEMVIITERDGMYRYSEQAGISHFTTNVDSELKTNSVNRVVMTLDSTIVVGTTINGIYAIKQNGECIWHFNRDKSFSNNTVLNLFCDNKQNIWACMDDGINYIHYNSPLTLYTPALYEPKFGMVFDVYDDNGYLYLATNQALYKCNDESTQLIPNTNAQNWYVTAFDNQIFFGNNYHSMTIKNDIGIPTPNTSGSTSIRKYILNGKDILIESSYNFLHIYKKDATGAWVFSNKIEGLNTPIKQLEIDERGTIWATHMYNGLYKIILNSNFTKVIKSQKIQRLNAETHSSNIFVIKILGRVVFSEDDKFYTYDDITHKIIPYEKLNKLLPGMDNVHSAVSISNSRFWLISEKEYIMIEYNDYEYKIITRFPFSVFDNPCLGREADVFVKNMRYSFLNLNNCVARYDCEYKPLPSKPNKLQLSFVRANSITDHMVLPLNEKGSVDSEFREITIELLFPHYDNIPVKYVYTLEGAGLSLEERNFNANIRFSGLNSGSYKFMTIAYDASNNEIGRVNYEFSIATPFYKTYVAILLYIILFIVSLYLVLKWNTRRVTRIKHKEYEQQQVKQKMKLNEQERLIAEQNKQILESELTIKSKELATMAMGAIAKNNALEELKGCIQLQLEKDTVSKKFLNTLLNQINDNITNQEFWDVFQQNFDLIHANFFRNLRARYPELTPTDLKFCALIRLNMTTKDIAQMTNLTIRGVEAARYRIRKKLGISESESMVNFLIELK